MGTVLLVLGVVLLGVWGAHKFLYFRSMTLSLRHASLFTSASAPVSYPAEILIGERMKHGSRLRYSCSLRVSDY